LEEKQRFQPEGGVIPPMRILAVAYQQHKGKLSQRCDLFSSDPQKPLAKYHGSDNTKAINRRGPGEQGQKQKGEAA